MNHINPLHSVKVYIFLIILLSGCTGEPAADPTPILPPPPPRASGADETEVTVSETPNVVSETPNAEETRSAQATADGAAFVEDLSNATPTSYAPTPTLLPTAVTVTDPPMQRVTAPSASSGQAVTLPPISRDLLFLADGSLKMWNHNGTLETLYASSAEAQSERESQFSKLAGDITQFSVSEDGNRVVAARLLQTVPISETVEGSDYAILHHYESYELLFLDVVSRDSWTIVPHVSNLVDLAISPNQHHVAFIGNSLLPNESPDLAAVTASPNLFVTDTPDGNTRPVTSCIDFCQGIAWHPDSNLFVWSDSHSLWLYNLSSSAPQSLLANQIDSGGNTRFYRADSWASNGRYLLLWQQAYEGGSRVVFDVPTSQLIPVPDSFTYVETFPTEVVWMQDDRLLVLRSNVDGRWQTTVEIWRVSLEGGELLLEEMSQPEPAVAAAGPIHLENGRFGYGLLHQTDASLSGLYVQTALSEPTERVNGLIPTFIAPNIVWSPDGAGAVVVQNNVVLYVPTDGSGVYEITAVMGQWPQNFVWLPPSNAPR